MILYYSLLAPCSSYKYETKMERASTDDALPATEFVFGNVSAVLRQAAVPPERARTGKGTRVSTVVLYTKNLT